MRYIGNRKRCANMDNVRVNLQIATVVSLSIICIVIISQFIGCSLPMLAKRCKLDPAVMAAPLITTIVDATSILIFFNIATRFFNL